jgi:hypothetical protein
MSDEQMSEEYETQKFVEGITEFIYDAIEDTDYRLALLELSLAILSDLHPILRQAPSIEYHPLLVPIRNKVRKKTTNDTEYRYIMLEIFEKVFVSVSSGIVHEKLREELMREREEC